MIDASTACCASNYIYDLTPNNQPDDWINVPWLRPRREDFNCVTAANKILLAGNINVLSNAKTPYDVKAIIDYRSYNFGDTVTWNNTLLQVMLQSANFVDRKAAEVVTGLRRLPNIIMQNSVPHTVASVAMLGATRATSSFQNRPAGNKHRDHVSVFDLFTGQL